MIVKNTTAGTVYLDIYQPSSPSTDQNYIPAGATVDLIADGNATQQEVFEALPFIKTMVEIEKLVVVSVGSVLSKSDSLDNIAIRFKSFLSPTTEVEWTEDNRLNDNAFLHNGVLAGGDHNGFIFDYDYEVVSVSWAQDHSDQHGGHFVFKNNSDQTTLGSVPIPSDGHGVEHTGTDFTAFKLPKNKRIGVQWQGTRITDVTVNVKLKEV